MKKCIDRLRRVRGQVEHLEHSLKENDSCSDVLPQLLAVKGAVDGVVRTYLDLVLSECTHQKDQEKMRTIIKALLKHS